MIPLSYRLKPKKIEDIVGQDHLLKKGAPIYNMIENKKMMNIILYGQSGVGKTTLADVLGELDYVMYFKINAAISNMQDLKDIVAKIESPFFIQGKIPLLFIDEIHAFNKMHQDLLLPYVEKGKLCIIAATTKNPYYEVNKALLSRMCILKLNDLTTDDVVSILKKALKDPEGLLEYNVSVSDEILEKIALASKGDCRYALGILENATYSSPINEDGSIQITEDILKTFVTKNGYEKNSQEHFDTISAYIKSVRGSDADAAVHYLARLIEFGEDIKYIARRLVILSCEDIGLANPQALQVATSAMTACEKIGLPEARIILSFATIYLCNSNKSNTAYNAINQALDDVRTKDVGYIPDHLVNGGVNLDKNAKYLYPHSFEYGVCEQQYMPDKLKDTKYYVDKWNLDFNQQKQLKKAIKELKKKSGKEN